MHVDCNECWYNYELAISKELYMCESSICVYNVNDRLIAIIIFSGHRKNKAERCERVLYSYVNRMAKE